MFNRILINSIHSFSVSPENWPRIPVDWLVAKGQVSVSVCCKHQRQFGELIS